MIADDVYHRNTGAAGIVKVGKTIRQTWTCVEQCCCRTVGHSGVTVGRPGDDALEKAKDATQFGLAIKRRDKMHFRCSGICEAHPHLIGQEGVAKAVRSIHCCIPPASNVANLAE